MRMPQKINLAVNEFLRHTGKVRPGTPTGGNPGPEIWDPKVNRWDPGTVTLNVKIFKWDPEPIKWDPRPGNPKYSSGPLIFYSFHHLSSTSLDLNTLALHLLQNFTLICI